ncbi:unnamed protein product [Mytilus coruscus]|uniref:Uncharacterized protein n=1 Tax=Mytilus coruscus TaxID=42192 RepID=A0A6J8DA80_MYTCO|nr:unnamed protein product [Mytilus coruscus]
MVVSLVDIFGGSTCETSSFFQHPSNGVTYSFERHSLHGMKLIQVTKRIYGTTKIAQGICEGTKRLENQWNEHGGYCEECKGINRPPSTSSATCSTTNDNNNKRKRSADSDSLEDRLTLLEKTTKIDKVKELKEKEKTICTQQDPSDLILLNLEELAKCSRRVNHEEADVFEELARHVNRHQLKLDIPNLCLSVLIGKQKMPIWVLELKKKIAVILS